MQVLPPLPPQRAPPHPVPSPVAPDNHQNPNYVPIGNAGNAGNAGNESHYVGGSENYHRPVNNTNTYHRRPSAPNDPCHHHHSHSTLVNGNDKYRHTNGNENLANGSDTYHPQNDSYPHPASGNDYHPSSGSESYQAPSENYHRGQGNNTYRPVTLDTNYAGVSPDNHQNIGMDERVDGRGRGSTPGSRSQPGSHYGSSQYVDPSTVRSHRASAQALYMATMTAQGGDSQHSNSTSTQF